MNLQDALYNWLSIKKVSDARKDDLAAQETLDFFAEILEEDHKVKEIKIETQSPFYIIHYKIEDLEHKKQFPIELIDALHESIESEPKYNN